MKRRQYNFSATMENYHLPFNALSVACVAIGVPTKTRGVAGIVLTAGIVGMLLLFLTKKKQTPFFGKGLSTCFESAIIFLKPFPWSNMESQEDYVRKTLNCWAHFSRWALFCSKVCQFWLEHVPDKLGGPSVEVEIETVISRRKYNRWRFGSSVALNGFPRRLWCHLTAMKESPGIQQHRIFP